MTNQPSDPSSSAAPGRWPFFRDVLVLQLKLLLGNALNLVMVPVSLVAAAYDLVAKPRARHGENFYKVLEVSRDIEESINVYGAIGGYHGGTPTHESAHGSGQGMTAASGWRGTTVDGVVKRVEDVIVREFGKGGTAASVKAAVDRVLDDIQRESKKKQ
jgi:hypothetical protein